MIYTIKSGGVVFQLCDNAVKILTPEKLVTSLSIEEFYRVACAFRAYQKPPELKIAKPRAKNTYSESFEQFWKLYPKERRVNKKGTYSFWDETDSVGIISGLKSWKESDSWDKGYIPNSDKFLRDRRWEAAEGSPKKERKVLT